MNTVLTSPRLDCHFLRFSLSIQQDVRLKKKKWERFIISICGEKFPYFPEHPWASRFLKYSHPVLLVLSTISKFPLGGAIDVTLAERYTEKLDSNQHSLFHSFSVQIKKCFDTQQRRLK
jgi:hypothetical protein